jgi:Flp pilus assembly pilin Flp
MERMTLRDRGLWLQIETLEMGRRAVQSVRRAASRATREEDGQTPTEYLMIVGFMAAVIVAVFVIFYWEKVKEAAGTWSQKVQDTVEPGDLSN